MEIRGFISRPTINRSNLEDKCIVVRLVFILVRSGLRCRMQATAVGVLDIACSKDSSVLRIHLLISKHQPLSDGLLANCLIGFLSPFVFVFRHFPQQILNTIASLMVELGFRSHLRTLKSQETSLKTKIDSYQVAFWRTTKS